jgi:lipoprotein NlpI
MQARFEKDLSTVDEQLASQPDSVRLHSKRGDLCLFLGKYRDAVSEFEKMITLDPAQDAPHWRLGIAYYFAGEFDKSALQFQKYHDYDGRDRENGIWKFLAQARASGIETARKEMLTYNRFDREPFPELYAMFAGEKTGENVLSHVKEKQLTADPNVMFFAHYYVGLNEELLGHHESAVDHLKRAVALFDSETAPSGGPGYMWQVARLHLRELAK